MRKTKLDLYEELDEAQRDLASIDEILLDEELNPQEAMDRIAELRGIEFDEEDTEEEEEE